MSDPATFQAALKGDRAALAAVLESCGDEVAQGLHGQISRQWQSVLSVDDVMQVTFLESFMGFHRFSGDDIESFKKWVRRIANNNLQDAIRGLSREKRPQPSKRLQNAVSMDSYVNLVEQMGADTTTIVSKAAKTEAKRLLDRALAKLPEDYATAIRLYDLEAKSGPEVAEAMNRSRGAVHMLRSRGIANLRDIIGRESNFFTFVSPD